MQRVFSYESGGPKGQTLPGQPPPDSHSYVSEKRPVLGLVPTKWLEGSLGQPGSGGGGGRSAPLNSAAPAWFGPPASD